MKSSTSSENQNLGSETPAASVQPAKAKRWDYDVQPSGDNYGLHYMVTLGGKSIGECLRLTDAKAIVAAANATLPTKAYSKLSSIIKQRLDRLSKDFPDEWAEVLRFEAECIVEIINATLPIQRKED